jgi:hypothetical protein
MKGGAMELDWTTRPVQEWHGMLKKVSRGNWLQSLPFARAAGLVDRQATRFAVVRSEGHDVGVMAMQEVRLGPIHFLNLYRGPLWFDADPPEEHLKEFAALFNKAFPRRLLRRRRWLPEWPDADSAKTILSECGFRPNAQTFETVWLDLQKSEAALRSDLDGKWRNSLNKGERSDITIVADTKGATADLFLHFYEIDRKLKKYRGRTANFLKEEISSAAKLREAVILWAQNKEKKPIAAILVIIHGQSATYRIGWTTDLGRAANAHNVLLWEATKRLKESGLRFFDLGGVEPVGAEGLTQFKKGMGGQEVKLLGVYK